MKGTYTLLLELDESKNIKVGSLGDREFKKGFYAYTGSALGPGGLKRVDRHIRVSKGENDTRQWHIDYLNGDHSTRILTVVKSYDKIECDVVERIRGQRVEDFGASDCGCDSHLIYSGSYDKLMDSVEEAYNTVSNEVVVESL
ncbi:MAG: GIY-YIG nuclease family protein [Halobacteria archaeon]|nr:GIY-YIG nuclease family protein [Halobacteria archaeon]